MLQIYQCRKIKGLKIKFCMARSFKKKEYYYQMKGTLFFKQGHHSQKEIGYTFLALSIFIEGHHSHLEG